MAVGEGDATLLDDAATDHDDILDEDVLTVRINQVFIAI